MLGESDNHSSNDEDVEDDVPVTEIVASEGEFQMEDTHSRKTTNILEEEMEYFG